MIDEKSKITFLFILEYLKDTEECRILKSEIKRFCIFEINIYAQM